MQKHLETDEVFVLISGSCNLYSAGTGDLPGEIIKVPMEMHKGYNVKKGVWHTHTLSEDAAVLIVENQDTSDDNSPIFPITEEMREVINALEYEEQILSRGQRFRCPLGSHRALIPSLHI